VKIFEYVFMLLSRFTGTNTFLALTRNTPYVSSDYACSKEEESDILMPTSPIFEWILFGKSSFIVWEAWRENRDEKIKMGSREKREDV